MVIIPKNNRLIDMCGGVGFQTKNISEEELKKYYSPELIKRFKKTGCVESFFWQDKAVLPVETKAGVQLMLWGNKDQNVKLPPTGWAREESLKEGKWEYLHPEPVAIPAESGYEKKTWFKFRKGTKGVAIERQGEKRVYMITKQAGKEYAEKTGHDREPLGDKENYQQEAEKQKRLF